MFGLADRHQTDHVAHAERRDHTPRHARGALDVVARPCSHSLGTEHQLLGDTASEKHRELALHPFLPVGMAVFGGQTRRDSKRPTTGHNRDFVHWVQSRNLQAENRVARLVVGGELALIFVQDKGTALGTEHNLVLRLVEVVHRDLVAVSASSQKRGLVADVLEVRTTHTRRAACDE